ncbi:tetratricopeptide repeat protein [Anoxybacillus rupiensis]|uniref:Tetratricopeptide repeat protein n=1 Tax=Anoxybacteroides rupiense TaxID=311460 RepID=A0ABT5W8D6_9BACL|nr:MULTISPECIES: tetratricopeptide repeat protein [Anoxybacillus]MBS2773098.1 tetratricopeptide repeat protein [Anoxybacillus rupiensis]MDE8565452.1 tetratricopeptide repeat protein [Anoxybacillus rupiensis]QHC04109.1 tetratricopeptide repeat protein [Anoxybacillus sp. PDR2]
MNISELRQLAEKFRREGDLQKAYHLLIPLEKTEVDNPFIHLEIGFTLDAMGKEEEAIHYYEKALSLGLPAEQRCVALLCLGSSLRNIGKLDDAKHILKTAMDEFPNHIGIHCFYALAQYHAGEHGQSVRTLINAILLLSPESVKPFTQSLQYYVNELK